LIDLYAFFDAAEIAPIELNAPLGGRLASWLYSTRLDKTTGELSNMKGHVHCFDYEYLVYRLKKIGFKHIWRSAFRKSIYPELQKDGFDIHPISSLFIEAILKR